MMVTLNNNKPKRRIFMKFLLNEDSGNCESIDELQLTYPVLTKYTLLPVEDQNECICIIELETLDDLAKLQLALDIPLVLENAPTAYGEMNLTIQDDYLMF